jgi:transglutaminase-like putative cysteine protease
VKLRVVHRTAYSYGDAVTTSRHEARLSPREHEHQHTISHHIEIVPRPTVRRRRFDYFGNRALHFCLEEPHRSLDVIATSVVEVSTLPLPDLAASPPWETVRDRLRGDRHRDVIDACEMTFDSPHVRTSAELQAYAAPSFPPGRPVLEAVRDLVTRIHHDFIYDATATEVSTPVATVLSARRGVCQDFAHVAIGCLRSLGLAARYVSGYLETRPPPGKARVAGADVSHAWVSAFVPGAGWVDVDPTNDQLVNDRYVTTAWGRDYTDVPPLKGVIFTEGDVQDLRVSVDVVPVDDPD